MAKRRANGEGSIRKRSDGRWEGRYVAGYDPKTGKRVTKNVLGKTQAEVRDKLKAAIKIAEETDLVRGEQYTLVQWLKYWMNNYGKVYLRPSSQKNYNGFLNHQQPHRKQTRSQHFQSPSSTNSQYGRYNRCCRLHAEQKQL